MLLRVTGLALILGLAAGAALLAAPSWLAGLPDRDGYELRCVLLPRVEGDGVYSVSFASVKGLPLRLPEGGYGEVVLAVKVGYDGLALGSYEMGPGSLVCESSARLPLVVDVVRGWEDSLHSGSISTASPILGFWARGAPVEVEFQGLSGTMRVSNDGVVVISDVMVFRVEPLDGRG